MAAGTGSPCGACKFLRRKCSANCVFAPYFCSEQGPSRFAAIHKVFGASNVSKMLSHVPVSERCEAVVTIAYEAQARVRDPVFGCVAHIFALQQQVECLQAQLTQVKAQMAQNLIEPSNVENQWLGNMVGGVPQINPNYQNFMSSIFPQSSLESIDHSNNFNGMRMQELQSSRDDLISFQPCTKKTRPSQIELGELQELALTMMKN